MKMYSLIIIKLEPVLVAEFLRIKSRASIRMSSCSDFLPERLQMNCTKIGFHELVGIYLPWHATKNSSKYKQLSSNKGGNNHDITKVIGERLWIFRDDFH